jgi:NAD+ diphosphatase
MQLPYNLDASLDRAWCASPDAAAAYAQSQQARFLALRQGQFLLNPHGQPQWLASPPPGPLFALGHSLHYPNLHLFAVDASELPDEAFPQGQWLPVRQAYGLAAPHDLALMSCAQGLAYWHGMAQFCGRCGTATHPHPGGQWRTCSSPSCGRILYPSIHPAVIMLVEAANDAGMPVCLLAGHHRSPAGLLTTLAGFMQLGEAPEEAVRREVLEEVGIAVGEVRYVASQSWPFPSSLMLGFRAKAVPGTPLRLVLEEAELASAAWFTAPELLERIGAGTLLPSRPDSIARRLIYGWLADQGVVNIPGSTQTSAAPQS